MDETLFSIEPVRGEDAAGCAETMMSAFYEEYHWRAMFHDKPLQEIIDDATERIPWNLVSFGPLRRYQKVVEKQSGKIVGYARWVLPDDLEGAWPDFRTPEVDEETKKEREKNYRAVLDENDRQRGLDHAMAKDLTTPLWAAEARCNEKYEKRILELDYLAVHPDYQRRCIGGTLLRNGFPIAEENNLTVMICARAQGIALYERNGFKMFEKIVQERPQYGWTEPQITAVLTRESA